MEVRYYMKSKNFTAAEIHFEKRVQYDKIIKSMKNTIDDLTSKNSDLIKSNQKITRRKYPVN